MPDQAEAVQVLRGRVQSLAVDLKSLFAIVDDADLDEEPRTIAAAAIFYSLHPACLIPAKDGALALADHAIAIRCALDDVQRAAPERAKAYAAAAPETWQGLDREIQLLSGLLGDLWQPLRDGWRSIGMQGVRGKSAKQAVADPEVSTWLYAAVDEALALLDVDEQAVLREVRGEPLLAKLQLRLASRKRG